MATEMVIPIEDLADPLPIKFTFKCTNVDDIIIYVKAELDTPPAGWNGSAQQLSALGIGIDDYFLCDSYTRDKPANLTEETVDLKISYYSDAGYSVLINSETVEFTITYVDFNDVSFNVVDDDTFDVNTEGWDKVTEVIPAFLLARSTSTPRTGAGALVLYDWYTNTTFASVGYAFKSFTISNVTRAFIRVWLRMKDLTATDESIFELITDAGGVNERVSRVVFDNSVLGGGEIFDQYVCLGLKMPVNDTTEVRLRIRAEKISSGAHGVIYFDDIRVVES